jgi:putative membrane protein
MKGIFLRWIALTLAILLASRLIEGIEATGFGAAFFAAAILGVLNAFFRPILFLLTLPINILTLGLFTFVINAVMLQMVSGVISGFTVHGFGAAFWGALLISLVSWGLTALVSERGTIEVIDLRRRDDDRWK